MQCFKVENQKIEILCLIIFIILFICVISLPQAEGGNRSLFDRLEDLREPSRPETNTDVSEFNNKSWNCEIFNITYL